MISFCGPRIVPAPGGDLALCECPVCGADSVSDYPGGGSADFFCVACGNSWTERFGEEEEVNAFYARNVGERIRARIDSNECECAVPDQRAETWLCSRCSRVIPNDRRREP